jgi:hypothetical protein
MIIAIATLLLLAPPQVPPCVEELGALLQREDFDALLAAATPCEHPRALYFTGIAQLAKGEPSRAIEALQRYVEGEADGEPPRLREIAALRLEQAIAELGVVEVTVEPSPGDGDIRLTIEREGGGEPAVTFLSTLEQRDGRPILRLPPGRYIITAARVGYLPTRSEFAIEAAGTVSVSISMKLRPRPAPQPLGPKEPEFPRRQWAAIWGGIGGGAVVVGVQLVVVGTRRSSDLLDQPIVGAAAIDSARADLARGTMLRAGGAGTLATGLGLMVGGLSGLAATERARKAAWTAEVSVAGVLMVVGAGLLGTAASSFKVINNSTTPTQDPWGPAFESRLTPSMRGVISGAALLGAGVGLGLSATLGLVSRKLLRPKPGVAARWQFQADGLTVSF